METSISSPPNRLRELRLRAGLSMREAADAVGASVQALCTMEKTGKKKLGRFRIYKLGELYGVDPKELVWDIFFENNSSKSLTK